MSRSRTWGGASRWRPFADPFGNVFGLIENPHFSLEDR